MNIQSWFPLGLTGLISLMSKGFLRVFSSTHSSKASILWCSAFLMVQLLHLYMTPGKTVALTTWTFVGKVISVLFNVLSRLLIAFLPRSKHLLISWLWSLSTVILELKKIKSVAVSISAAPPPSICHEVMGPLSLTCLIFPVLTFSAMFLFIIFTGFSCHEIPAALDRHPSSLFTSAPPPPSPGSLVLDSDWNAVFSFN